MPRLGCSVLSASPPAARARQRSVVCEATVDIERWEMCQSLGMREHPASRRMEVSFCHCIAVPDAPDHAFDEGVLRGASSPCDAVSGCEACPLPDTKSDAVFVWSQSIHITHRLVPSAPAMRCDYDGRQATNPILTCEVHSATRKHRRTNSKFGMR